VLRAIGVRMRRNILPDGKSTSGKKRRRERKGTSIKGSGERRLTELTCGGGTRGRQNRVQRLFLRSVEREKGGRTLAEKSLEEDGRPKKGPAPQSRYRHKGEKTKTVTGKKEEWNRSRGKKQHYTGEKVPEKGKKRVSGRGKNSYQLDRRK